MSSTKFLNPWFALSLQATQLAWDSQQVIALRLLRLAGGGIRGHSEARRMVNEKAHAFTEAHVVAANTLMKYGNGDHVAKNVLGVYRKRVRANKRRLAG